eukprot:scaffold281896_cov34-Tisochrysis_lutea.AAC.6
MPHDSLLGGCPRPLAEEFEDRLHILPCARPPQACSMRPQPSVAENQSRQPRSEQVGARSGGRIQAWSARPSR